MRILIDINHPAHVHLFKNFAWRMQKKGHEILFTTRQKEISDVLLENLGFRYICFGKHYKSMKSKLWGIFKYDIKMLKVAHTFKPDLFLSMCSIYASHAAFLMRKFNILLTDTENATLQHILAIPFCNTLLTPACFSKDYKGKHIRYSGYHELSYLHPNIFQPDQSVLNEIDININDRYTFIRFVSWSANHDVGHRGMSNENKIRAVNEFLKYGKVLISSEDDLPSELKEYQINIRPELIHHVLASADLVFGESATMASESAVLGTPAIYLDNVGRGYTDEQEYKYGLVFNFTESADDQRAAIIKGCEILNANTLKSDWGKRKEKLLHEKIDVTAFLVWFVEYYPQSAATMKNDSMYQYRFR
jgi:uncharacterized protein